MNPKHGGGALLAIAAVAVLVAGCGGSPSSASRGSSRGGASPSSSSAVAYSACMRSHGVPSYPDPNGRGQPPKANGPQLGVSDAQFQAAQRACQDQLPSTGGSFIESFQQCVSAGVCPPALVQQALTMQRAFARCMRRNGVPNFPDPQVGHNGAPYFPAAAAGLSRDDTHSSTFESRGRECQREAGGAVPLLMG